MNKEKNAFEKVANKLKIKKIIKNSKEKGLIKPVKDAFKSNLVEKENHKGDANYFLR